MLMYRRHYIGAFALILLIAASAEAQTLEGFWQLEERLTTQPAADSSGNGIAGTYTGGVNPNVSGPAGFGSAADFDGSSGYVNLGSPASLTSQTNNLSVEAWVNTDTVTGIHRIVSSDNAGWSFGILDDGLRFTTFGVKDYDFGQTTGLISTGVWTHVAAVMDTSNDVTFYKNGASVGTVTHTAPGNPGAGSYHIGKAGGEWFNGRIDQAAAFSGTLDADDLTNHMNGSFQESFATDTPDTATTLTTYPDFSFPGGGVALVNSGVLNLRGNSNIQYFERKGGFLGDLFVRGEVGRDFGTSGCCNVGLSVGANRIVMHPGYPNGAFRVEGPSPSGNQNMGFTPANAPVLHPMEVKIDAATGKFLIAVVDGSNADNIYRYAFTDAGYAQGTDQIGLTWGGGTGAWGFYDDFAIEKVQVGNLDWSNTIAASSPRHWFRLDDEGAVAFDMGSAALHGSYQNGVVQGQAGQVNGAVRFDGNDDLIQLGGGNLNSDWSAEFLLSKQGTDTHSFLLLSGVYSLRLDQWNNTGQVGYTHGGVLDYTFTPAVTAPTDEFIQLVYVADQSANRIDLYVDGLWVGSNNAFIPLPLDVIGRSTFSMDAIVDEIVLYDRALSATEVLDHAIAAGVPEPSAFLLAAIGLLGLLAWRRR